MPTHHTLINGDCRHMSQIKDQSVQLIVTSPPYWQLKDYGDERQIGFNDTYEQYVNNLNVVWSECYRILQDGCRLCINIGDQFARSLYYGRYKVIPIHSEIIRFCESIGFDYMGSIIWQKPTTMHTSGGASVMGSYPYPRGGIMQIDFEYILLFRKQGKAPSISQKTREVSKLSNEEWNTYFSSHWKVNGARQDRHIAVFPEEIPLRLIKMFSFVGDTICDPFMGSGTTALAARDCERNSIGYEINPQFRLFYNEKVIATNTHTDNLFEFSVDNTPFSIEQAISYLPYQFVDTLKLNKQIDVEQHSCGSIFTVNRDIQAELNRSNIPDTESEIINKATVLVNHVTSAMVDLSISKGITYVRAGESKGSLLVKEGFENLSYVCLHTSGNNPQLFKLSKRGFQIWTPKALQELGFSAENAPYYAVLHFDGTKPIKIKKAPPIKNGRYTTVAHILSIGEFK